MAPLIAPGDPGLLRLDDGDGFADRFTLDHLEDVLGYEPCGNLGWDSDGNPTLCLQRFGVEHSHG